VAIHVIAGAILDRILRHGVPRAIRRHVFVGSALVDQHKDQSSALASHQVDFTRPARRPVFAVQHDASVMPQKTHGQLFRQPPHAAVRPLAPEGVARIVHQPDHFAPNLNGITFPHTTQEVVLPKSDGNIDRG
jgi:hypothetical protein